MTRKDIRAEISRFIGDFNFAYMGKDGVVVPLNDAHGERFICAYNKGEPVTMHTIDEVMALPFLAGKSFDEVIALIEAT